MKIEIRDSNPAVVDPPLEVWLRPTADGQGAALMGQRGDTTAMIARLTKAELVLCEVPEKLGLRRSPEDRVFILRG